jgi:esterase
VLISSGGRSAHGQPSATNHFTKPEPLSASLSLRSVSPVSSKHIKRNGLSIAYAVRNAITPSTQTPIVFLHGLASNRTRWNEFIRETSLSTSRDLIAVDLRGHGESITRRAFSLEVWSDDLAAVLDAEQREDTLLIGHSLGAQAALHFALAHPNRVAGLVLIDPIFREAVAPAKRNYVRFGPLFQFAARAIRMLNRLGIHRGTP